MDEDELKLPYVSQELIEYLERLFTLDFAFTRKTGNNDECIGYLKGTRDIINNLKNIHVNQ